MTYKSLNIISKLNGRVTEVKKCNPQNVISVDKSSFIKPIYKISLIRTTSII